MKFYAPHWLWGLLFLPVLFALLFWDEKKRKQSFSLFAEKKLWPLIAPELAPQARLKKGFLILSALGLCLVALSRPQVGTHEETVHVSGLDILVVLDVSNSMDAQDVVPSRLEKAKHLVRSLAQRLEGDRMGLVAFASSAYVACPLTTDLDYFLETLQMMGPRLIQNQGTDVGTGLTTAFKAMERGAEEEPTHANEVPSHVIILISDGEDHEEQAIQAASILKDKGTRLFVLGVGTEKGGPIPLRDENGVSRGFKKGGAGQPILSSFHPDFLKKVAATAGGKYWDVTPGESEVQSLYQELAGLNRGDYAERKFIVYEERYQIPLFLAFLILVFELSLPARKLLSKDEGGRILGLLGLSLGAVSFLGSSLAMAELKGPDSLEVYLENKKGIQAFQDGKFDEAQQRFGAAQARDPGQPELEFNQGTIQFQKEDLDRAAGSFAQAARLAQERKDSSLMGKSLYNLGNVLAKKGSVEDGARAYMGAIQAAREARDTDLEEAARKNLQLLVKEAKKQEQQKKDQEKQKDKDKDKEEEKKSGDQNKDSGTDQEKNSEKNKNESNKDTQEKQTKKYKDPQGKQKFESKKMTPEDADRVMSELKSKERQLQEKLQTQHARPKNNSKDW